jgi:copper transport protein
MTRKPPRFALFVAVTAFAIAGWAVPAFGHAQLQSTDPASGTVLAKSPGTVVLRFGEDVEVQFGAIRVYDANSKRVDTGNAYHLHGDGRVVAVNLASNLPSGGYVVTWRVISADSHPVHGAFTFLIGSGGSATTATAARIEAARLLATTGGSRTVGLLFGFIRFASFASMFVLVGGVAFLVGIWPDGRTEPRSQAVVRTALVAAIVSAALAIALQGPYGGGLPLAKALSPRVIREVLGTRFGQVYLARIALLVVAAAPLVRRLFQPAPPSPRWRRAAAVTGAAILLTPGLAGHAAAGSLIALAIPFDLVHMAAIAIWLGGLAMLAIAVLTPRTDRTRTNPFATVVPRFSQWALAAVVAIAVSGGFAAWRQIGSLSAVTTTPFGRLVLAKTIIFAVAVAAATRSRRLTHGNLALPLGLSRRRARTPVTPAPAAAGAAGGAGAASGAGASGGAGPPTRRRSRAQRQADLRRVVLIEVLLATVIVALAAVLVNAQPARQVLSQPFSTEVHAGPNVLVDVVVDPAKAGPVAIHLYTLSAAGAQLDVPEVTANLSQPRAGISNLKVPLQHGGVGHFLVGGFVVPVRGTWILAISVRTTEFDEFTASPVKVTMR